MPIPKSIKLQICGKRCEECHKIVSGLHDMVVKCAKCKSWVCPACRLKFPEKYELAHCRYSGLRCCRYNKCLTACERQCRYQDREKMKAKAEARKQHHPY